MPLVVYKLTSLPSDSVTVPLEIVPETVVADPRVIKLPVSVMFESSRTVPLNLTTLLVTILVTPTVDAEIAPLEIVPAKVALVAVIVNLG